MADESVLPADDEEEDLLSDTEAELTDMAKSQNGDEGSLADTEAETTEVQEGDESG